MDQKEAREEYERLFKCQADAQNQGDYKKALEISNQATELVKNYARMRGNI